MASKIAKLLKKKYVISVVVLFAALYLHLHLSVPLNDGFSHPWKYRIMMFGADIFKFIQDLVHFTNICHPIYIARFGYSLGHCNPFFSVRNPDDNIYVKDDTIDSVQIRMFKPLNSGLLNKDGNIPVIFYYHGGAYFFGEKDVLEPVSYYLAKQTESLVFYIEYRLLPEHKYPAALDDSYKATRDILNDHKKYNIDLDNVILLGDSAGGNLASVVCRKLIEERKIRPKLSVLIYPLLQLFDFTLPSYIENLPKNVLGNMGHESIKILIQHYTGYEIDDTILENGHHSSEDKEKLSERISLEHLPTDYLTDKMHLLEKRIQKNCTIHENVKKILLHEDVSPLLVDDYTLKEYSAKYTYIISVGYDILKDENFIYANRLRNVGANVKHEHYEGLFHGIFGLYGLIPFDSSHLLMKSVSDYVKYIIKTE